MTWALCLETGAQAQDAAPQPCAQGPPAPVCTHSSKCGLGWLATHAPFPRFRSPAILSCPPLLSPSVSPPLGLELQDGTSLQSASGPRDSSTDISPGSTPNMQELPWLPTERRERRGERCRPLSPLSPLLAGRSSSSSASLMYDSR